MRVSYIPNKSGRPSDSYKNLWLDIITKVGHLACMTCQDERVQVVM